MIIKVITIGLASFILLTVIELIREEKLTFKYAGGWIVVSVLAILFAVFDQLILKISSMLGFELASNFIFFALLSVLVLLSLLMSLFLCQQNRRNDTMAQKIGILEFEIEKLKGEKKKNEKDHDTAGR